jgi:hypothetical protein
VFLEDPAAWATQLPPVLLPEACREMVYKFQVRLPQGLHQARHWDEQQGCLDDIICATRTLSTRQHMVHSTRCIGCQVRAYGCIAVANLH